MMKFVIALVVVAASTGSASAKDVMLVLNDQEQAALRRVLDSATKSEGMQLAPITVYLLNKLNSAAEVVERKDGAPEQDKAKPQ